AMAMEKLFSRIDRLAGGGKAGILVPSVGLELPKTKRAFAWITWLLVFVLVLGLGAVVYAIVIARAGERVPFAVWMRTVVVLGMSANLLYVVGRASMGFYWGYQLLRLFTQIFPVIARVRAAIRGLSPVWTIT